MAIPDFDVDDLTTDEIVSVLNRLNLQMQVRQDRNAFVAALVKAVNEALANTPGVLDRAFSQGRVEACQHCVHVHLGDDPTDPHVLVGHDTSNTGTGDGTDPTGTETDPGDDETGETGNE